ncbi:RWD domain-containing protein 1-like protein [Dinothrombium tinctorium]|uniref:RWD domain-containing protein 1-like protein n=1 Tax=Dinothrombium tinctorium TaxID=1965070 RepID=A0A3S3NRB4_9ACAR|nr:RWD domain-containing protein 1-like protein [Dinothrombium tinctorium]RWS05130.1 RWD domain-containing protein 1-like protein [Dinothrombium tinctorium]RWS08775.1 RWD domain-containing protein 1-like protein [Dinothrombium tinctorium]
MSAELCLEEQINEIEALESIYCNEITVISKSTPIKFSINVNGDNSTDSELELQLTFTFTRNYPEEAPEIEVSLAGDNFDENDEQQLLELLNNEANNNLGMVMVFTLVSVATEWLNTKRDQQKVEKQREVERRKREEEEAEMKKFEGTRVTVESFLAWKRKFELEMAQINQKQSIDLCNKKLTGKELFEKDKTLNESDLAFIGEGEEFAAFEGQVVDVDESLFQDLDDLDINDVNDS